MRGPMAAEGVLSDLERFEFEFDFQVLSEKSKSPGLMSDYHIKINNPHPSLNRESHGFGAN